MWKANSPDCPWVEGVKPQLPEPFTIERALKLMDEAGIDRAVFVPAGLNWTQRATRSKRPNAHPDRFAVMGRMPLDDPKNRPTLLAELEEQPGMLGIRRHSTRPERSRG